MTIQWKLNKIIIGSDSQLVVNTISGKNYVPKDTINLVGGILILTSFFQDIRSEYYSRLINKKPMQSLERPITSLYYMYL